MIRRQPMIRRLPTISRPPTTLTRQREPVQPLQRPL